MSLTANGSQAVLLRDVASIRMDLDGGEQVSVRALGGADNVTVGDLSGTDVRNDGSNAIFVRLHLVIANGRQLTVARRSEAIRADYVPPSRRRFRVAGAHYARSG